MATLDQVKLTQRVANAAEGNGKKYLLHDHKISRMKLRVTPAGKKTWIIMYYVDGQRQREMALGSWETMTIDMARDEASKKLAALDSGEDPLEAKKRARLESRAKVERTLVSVFEAYQQTPGYTTKRDSTRSGYDTSFNIHILPRIGEIPVDEIGTRQVASLLDALHREKSGSVSNAAKRALSVVLGYAVEQELAPFNAAKQVKPRHKDKRRARVLSDQELIELWSAINDLDGMTETVAGVLKLCMLLPARVGEVSGMNWSELDLETRLWTVPAGRMKNHKDHEVPLCASVVTFLTQLKARSEAGWVFLNKDGTGPIDGKRAGRACGRLAGRKEWASFGPHDLRRSYATRMGALGFPADLVRRTLSHDVNAGDAFWNYDHHDYRDSKRLVLEAWEQELLKIVEKNNTSQCSIYRPR
ncbi:MAG: tyrosine-type recombinase/integrase [Hyphomonadaceae bacterium]